MSNRLLIILGITAILGLSGCVGADFHGGVYNREHSHDPWYDNRHPFPGDYFYYSFPGYFYYPRHYPVIIEKYPDGRHYYKKGLRGDGYRRWHPGDRQWRDGDRWRKHHDHDRKFTKPQRGLKCNGPRC